MKGTTSLCVLYVYATYSFYFMLHLYSATNQISEESLGAPTPESVSGKIMSQQNEQQPNAADASQLLIIAT